MASKYSLESYDYLGLSLGKMGTNSDQLIEYTCFLVIAFKTLEFYPVFNKNVICINFY